MLNIELREPTPEDFVRANSKKDKVENNAKVSTSVLGKESVEDLLKSAAPIETDGKEVKDFHQRKKSVPAPKTGKMIEQSFPPKEEIKKPKELEEEEKEIRKELKVLRYMPEGKDLDTIPMISVTFNQPMIPIGRIDDLKELKVPVEVSPKIEGEWRWMGTKTIQWKPTYRLPKSTTYTVKVPAGVESEYGCKLKEEVSFQFNTIPLRIKKSYPHRNMPVGENGVFFIEFNQKINKEEILKTCNFVNNKNRKAIQMKLLSKEDVKSIIGKDGIMEKKRKNLFNAYNSHLQMGIEENSIWFKAVKPIEKGSNFTFTVEKGTYSAEGKDPLEKKLQCYFDTYKEMIFKRKYPKDNIVPRQTLTLYFSNNIELEEFDKKYVTIEPKIEGVEIRPNRDNISVIGNTKGRTKYKITVSTELKDVFGQNLKSEASATFNVGSAKANLYGFFNGKVITLDPTINETTYSVVSINIDKIRFVVYQVSPYEFNRSPFGADYYHFRIGYSESNVNRIMNCGKKVYDKEMKIEHTKDEIKETTIDLKPFLQNQKDKLGQLIVYAEPVSWKERSSKPKIKTWVQVTKMALQAHSTNGNELNVFLSSLEDGSVVKDAKLSLFSARNSKVNMERYKSSAISTTSEKSGLTFMNGNPFYGKGGGIVMAEKDGDVCFIRNISLYSSPNSRYLNYIINDRGLYKPTEEVSVKGFFRRMVFGTHKKSLEIPSKEKLNYNVTDARGAKITKGTVKLDENGSFFVKFKTKENVNLGQACISFSCKKFSAYHYFKIEEFRTPEFNSSCIVENAGPHLVNNVAIVKGKAEYYSGGGLSGSKIDYIVTQSYSSFSPPGYSFKGYKFQTDYQEPGVSKNNIFSPFSSQPSSVNSVNERKIFSGVTDSNGKHQLCVDFKTNPKTKKYCPTSIKVDCNVQDINRQTMSSSTNFIVHPANLYCGIKLGKPFIKAGEILPLDLIVADLDGTLIAGKKVSLKIIRRIWEQKGYSWKQKDIVLNTVEITSKEEPVLYNLTIKEGGQFFFVTSLQDDDGNINQSSQSIYVSGGSSMYDKKGNRIEKETIKLIANKKKYEIGDTAKILASCPLNKEKMEGFYFVYNGNGFVESKTFSLKGEESTVIEVPIKDMNYVPEIKVKVEVVGKQYRKDEPGRNNTEAPLRPAFASGEIIIYVPPKEKEIGIKIENPAIMAPGQSGVVNVQLDNTPKGKKSKVSLIIVDEAILALTGHTLPHPISTFYPNIYPCMQDIYLRQSIFIKDWNSIRIEAPPIPVPKCAPGCFGGGGLFRSCCRSRCDCACNCSFSSVPVNSTCCFAQKCCSLDDFCCEEKSKSKTKTGKSGGKKKKAINVRTNFNPLACFLNEKETDENGKVSFKFKLPDNLTRYRVWVLATNDTSMFGLEESAIKAQLPLSLRPSCPRFLNFGDKALVSVVIQNQAPKDLNIQIGCRMLNLKFTPKDGKEVEGYECKLPEGKRVELRFAVETKSVGTGKIQFVASTGDYADAAMKSFPIYTPSTSEAFATYGEIDNDGSLIQSILPPKDIYTQFGGLKLSVSSTALQSLTDAFLYIYNYKFDCVEQISSKMMSIFALKDILSAFNVPKMPSKQDMQKVVSAGEKKIKSAQRSNGTIGFWTINSDVNIYLSIHVAHCLIRGIETGYKIDETILARSKRMLYDVEKHINSYYNRWYTEHTKASLIAFACYTLTHFHLNKQLSPTETKNALKKCEDLLKKYKKYLSFEGKFWVAFALFYLSPKGKNHAFVEEMLKNLNNNMNETAETANVITSYGDKGSSKMVMLHSNRRTDGVCLEVLIHIDPKNYIIPKLVKGLLAGKVKGRWGSTQENIYILLALKKYFKTFEKLTPNFIARVWLGEQYAGEMKFKGRTTDTKIINIPMKHLFTEEEKQEKKQLGLLKEGKGRLYYRLGMDYAPKNLKLKPIDYGFKVERSYEGVTDKSHARYDKEKDCWIFKAGELIRSKLTMTNNSRRYHVALADYLPAGCEALNPELKGTAKEASVQDEQLTGRNGRRPWYWWRRPWYCHHNLRTERVEAFSNYLYCGEHKFSYVMRATSLGTYVIPPCKAEEMYSPEIFGRSGSEKVIIEC